MTQNAKPIHAGHDTAIPFSTGTTPPRIPVPPPACDCHMHIYGDGSAATQDSPHAQADVANYLRLRQRLALARTVIVTPSAHGLDNSLTLNAIAQLGASARGVAVIAPSCDQAELERLHRGGIRGIRVNLVQRGSITSDMLDPLARRIGALGWHIQLNLSPDLLSTLEARLLALPVPVVLDHIARVDSLDNPGYASLARMLESGRVWVKLSGPYLIDQSDAARTQRLQKLGQTISALAPQRLLWGSNWPHPSHESLGLPLPDDAERLDQVSAWMPDERTRQRIFVENPQELYQFE